MLHINIEETSLIFLKLRAYRYPRSALPGLPFPKTAVIEILILQ